MIYAYDVGRKVFCVYVPIVLIGWGGGGVVVSDNNSRYAFIITHLPLIRSVWSFLSKIYEKQVFPQWN